jgi:hypothetical protein
MWEILSYENYVNHMGVNKIVSWLFNKIFQKLQDELDL